MKIMLIWPMPAPEVKILLDRIERAGHEIVYWVGEWPVSHLSPNGAVFHDHYDAWDARPAETFAQEAFPPPSAELIASMYETESLILTMMNKRYDKAPVDERKHIYYTMLGYWDAVLDRLKPEAIIFNDIPHSIYSNIIHDLAKRRGIPRISFEDTWVALRLLSYGDFWKGSDGLRVAIKRAQKRGITLSDLGEELRSYYVVNTREKPGTVPTYLMDQKNMAEGAGLARHRAHIAFSAIRSGLIFRLVLRYVSRLLQKNLRDEYGKLQKPADLQKPFVYFPLSFQPERTTSPQGGVYHDQILAVETLACALPPGWRIYVKEHPSQWWVRGKTRYSSTRYRGYYERIARISRVTLVPSATSSFELIRRARAIATVTGTAGGEALLQGKRPLIFGLPWYRDCPGLFVVRSSEECKAAFSELQKNGSVAGSEILAFLKALEEMSVRAHIGTPTGESPHINNEDNMRAISEAVCVELKGWK